MSRLRTALLAGAATLGCVVYVPAPEPPAEEVSAGTAEAEASPPPDGPSLESLRGDRNGWVDYRLLTQDDFQAKTSYVLWGNVLHAAEICVHIFPLEGKDDTTALHAMMQPRCSFWNHSRKVVDKVSKVAAAAAGVLLLGDTQPDWYILQHEQLHFAIAEAAALRYSRALAKVEPARRDAMALRLYEVGLERLGKRQAQLDRDTSGTFDPRALEKWTRVLESELKELCGKGPKCKVRTQDPQAQ